MLRNEGKAEKVAWVKEGDFSRYYNSGANLNRYVEFKNKKTDETLFIGGYKRTDHLQIIYRNKELAKTLLERCYDLEIPVEDDLIGGVILNSNNKSFIALFINTIAEMTAIPIETRDEMLASIPASLEEHEFKSESIASPRWIKEGSGEFVTYKNLKALRDREEIFIGTYPSTDEVRIIYSNKKLAPQLLEKCRALEIPVEDDLIGGLILNSNNKKILTAFIDAIDAMTPISKQEKNQILTSFPWYLRDEEFKSSSNSISKWIKEGDFSRYIKTGTPLKKMVTYKNVKALIHHEEIFVGGYSKTDEIRIIYKNKNKQDLNEIISRCRYLNIPVKVDGFLDDVILDSNDKNHLMGLMDVINSVRSLDKEIVEDFRKIVTENVEQESSFDNINVRVLISKNLRLFKELSDNRHTSDQKQETDDKTVGLALKK